MKVRTHLKHGLCLIFIITFLLSIVLVHYQVNQNLSNKNQNYYSDIPKIPFVAGPSAEDLIPPYRIHLINTSNFLKNNFESDYSDLLYYRRGDVDGNIIDDAVYSFDNLLFYKTVEKYIDDLSGSETYSIYEDLKSTNLWYYGNNTSYGFIDSINGSTGDVINYNRSLIDNVMPIILLLDNYASSSDTDILNMYHLINRQEFWDTNYEGYLHTNSSLGVDKYAEDQLYAILAQMLIAQSSQFDDPTTQNEALNKANQTMELLVDKLWDNQNYGFDFRADSDWSDFVGSDDNEKYLSVNALGIMALLDCFTQTNQTVYLNNATSIFQKMEIRLWNDTLGLYYHNTHDASWTTELSFDTDKEVNLEDNALMMEACLKLFDVTGNITFYDRAFEMYQGFESNFYDESNHAYDYIIFPASLASDNKNLTSNLQLIDAYLQATDIYGAFQLSASFNVTDTVPDYIFNQDVMNITSRLSYDSFMNTTFIPDVNMVYELQYPLNDTTFEVISGNTDSVNLSHTLIYNITDALPYGDGYRVIIWVNSTKFCYKDVILSFNVISGLVAEPIEGLGLNLYQGPTYNISITINNTRYNNVTLNITMQCYNIINQTQENVEFLSYLYQNETIIYFNVTTRPDAELGPDVINFRFTLGTILYLEINASIVIGDSFKYTPLFYENEVVNGEYVQVTFNLKNYLLNATQSINVSFSGDDLINSAIFPQEVPLNPDELKFLIYQLEISSTDQNTTILMELSKYGIVYYNESIIISVVDPLETLRTTYPSSVAQWSYSHLIMMVENNKKSEEDYTLTITEQDPQFNLFPTNMVIEGKLAPGSNRLEALIYSTINPYEFGVKTYYYELKDSNGEIIESGLFQVNLELSITALFFCYIIPISIPIIGILVYKNKELKNKQLRSR